MHFEEDHIYHIYNRANETVFYSRENYLYFIDNTRRLIYPFCDILAWCMMPNHFHFLIQANLKTITLAGEKHRPTLQVLSKNLGTLLSSYTQALNKSKKRKGKLFAHNTQAKLITHQGNEYLKRCFFYIHQNPLEAGLVSNIEDWKYCSFPDYAGLRNGTLCNISRVQEMLNISKEHFLTQSEVRVDVKDFSYR